MKDTLRRSYDRSAETYDATFRALQVVKYRALLGADGGLLHAVPGRILDLGCGTGLLAEFLGAAATFDPGRIVGLDLSERMLRGARARGVRAVQADLDHLPFQAGAFAFVCAFTSLRIVEGPDAPPLAEIARVLAPGGVLCLSVLERTYTPDLLDALRAAGFAPGRRVPAGQDVGFACARI